MSERWPDRPVNLNVGDTFIVSENSQEVEHTVIRLRAHTRGRRYGTWVKVSRKEPMMLLDPGEPIRIIRRA